MGKNSHGLEVGGLDAKLEFISGQIAEFVRRYPYRTLIGINLDASGNGQKVLYETREFASFELHRIVLQTVAHGPGNPYAKVGSWVGLYRNDIQPGNLIDYIPSGQTLFPSNFVAPGTGAEVLEANSYLQISIVGGPPNDLVLARVQGVFHPDWRTVRELGEAFTVGET